MEGKFKVWRKKRKIGESQNIGYGEIKQEEVWSEIGTQVHITTHTYKLAF